ncbi:MAG TPA: NAD(P)/FAD-dependent oxidoreductase [Abditibacteriaceae bacterium]|nr:NAD(P)/FAD-dependent oxidoreductase [Abditibacteriaceae bacterium]
MSGDATPEHNDQADNDQDDTAEQSLPRHVQEELRQAQVISTDDPGAGAPAHAETHQEPVHSEDMPKAGMDIPHPPVDALFDVTIIGGGTTGLFAAFYAGMREMSVKIIDSLEELGGQVTALYPEKYIYDVAGFPEVKGKELIEGCARQGLQFGPTVCLGEKAEHLEKQEDGTFLIATDAGSHHTKTVVIAAGVGAFAPRKLANLPELEALEGSSVHYFVKSLEIFHDKNILIVGGGDSALDWSLNLEPIAKHITLIHRRDKWRAHEDSVNRLMRSSVDVRVFHEVRSVQQEDGVLHSVTIFNNKTQEDTVLKVDAIILNLGFIANLGPIREWGVTIVDGGVAVDSTMATSVPGVYAAGDVTRYTGKLNLIATGFAEAATAANYAKNFIDPTSRVFPGHSSEKST